MMRGSAIAIFLCLAACGAPDRIAAPARPGESEIWYGAYLGGRQVGYLRKVSGKTPAGGIRLYSEDFISAMALDKPFSIRAIETLEATADFKPETYFQTIDAQMGAPHRVRGFRRGGRFLIEVEKGGRILKEKSFSLDELTFPQLADLSIRNDDISVGKSWTFNVMNPADFLPIRITIHVDRMISQEWRGGKKNVFQVTARLGTVEIISYMDTEQLEPGRIEIPSMDLMYVLEDETAARRVSEAEPGAVDLAYFAASIPTGGAMPDGPVKQVRVRLYGPSFAGLQLSGDDQRIETSKPKDMILDIRMADLSRLKDRIGDRMPTSPGQPDTAVLTAELQKLADRFLKAGTAGQPLAFSRLAVDWMQKNIRQTATSIVPNAADVLELRQGDCNEFSSLFYALATAAEFPCRIATGVVHSDGRYLYHSWNEILVDGRWVAVDPIFDEIPASPRHIKLVEGDFSASWRLAGLLRTLRIEILPNFP